MRSGIAFCWRRLAAGSVGLALSICGGSAWAEERTPVSPLREGSPELSDVFDGLDRYCAADPEAWSDVAVKHVLQEWSAPPILPLGFGGFPCDYDTRVEHDAWIGGFVSGYYVAIGKTVATGEDRDTGGQVDTDASAAYNWNRDHCEAPARLYETFVAYLQHLAEEPPVEDSEIDVAPGDIPLPKIRNLKDLACGRKAPRACSAGEFAKIREDLKAHWAVAPVWVQEKCTGHDTYRSVTDCLDAETREVARAHRGIETPWTDHSEALENVLYYSPEARAAFKEIDEYYDGLIEELGGDPDEDETSPPAAAAKPQEREAAAKIRMIVVEHLGVDAEKITAGARYIEDLGADDLDAIELVMALEEEFGVASPDETAETTFGNTLAIVGKATGLDMSEGEAPANYELPGGFQCQVWTRWRKEPDAGAFALRHEQWVAGFATFVATPKAAFAPE